MIIILFHIFIGRVSYNSDLHREYRGKIGGKMRMNNINKYEIEVEE